MIILYLGDGIKSYRENYLRYLPEKVVCPVCTGDCHWHGQYQRKVRENYEIHTITIRRVLCVTCRKTHALLPDFYAKYSPDRSEEHTSELQSRENLVCRLLL